MNNFYRADLDVQFIISGFTFVKDGSITVSSCCHVNSNVQIWLVKPSHIKVKQNNLKVSFLYMLILIGLVVEISVIDIIYKLISFCML